MRAIVYEIGSGPTASNRARFFVVDAVRIQVSLISRAEDARAQAAFEAFADTLATPSAPAQEFRVSRP